MTAAEALAHALADLADQGRRTPCQGRRRDRWVSDSADERAWAASVCRSLACPVLEACGAAADEQGARFHVWGGTDRTAPASRRYSMTTRRVTASSSASRTTAVEDAS